jgi:hypothetical protein
MQNAFSECLGSLGFDFHQMLVPDLLHEFEIGVFKSVFIHLIRLLYHFGVDLVITLNERYVCAVSACHSELTMH